MPSKVTKITGLATSGPAWKIHARVVSKTPVKQWSNAKGKGSLFSIVLQDNTSTIRVTFFKKAVDQFYGKVAVGKIYSFSKGVVKLANQRFNTTKSHLEIIMDTNSEIVLLEDEGIIENKPPTRVTPTITPPKALRKSIVDGGIIKQGDWKKEPDRSLRSVTQTTSSLGQTNSKSNVTVSSSTGECMKPLHDSRLTDKDRAKLRADRAAAAEARIKKQQRGGTKKKKRKTHAPLVSPHSSKRMRWNLG